MKGLHDRRHVARPLRASAPASSASSTPWLSWWTDVVREATYGGYHTRVVQLHHRYGMIMFIASEVMFFVAWFWAYFDASLFRQRPDSVPAHRVARRHLAAEGHRDLRSLAPAAAQHLDPADLGHHRDLGAPRAPRKRPPGPEGGPVADDRARRALHLRAGLRVQPRRLRLQRQHLRRDLLHGDRLPRRACDHRDRSSSPSASSASTSAISRRSSISVSSSPPGTGISSTWCGSSSSPSIYVWGYGGHAAAGH